MEQGAFNTMLANHALAVRAQALGQVLQVGILLLRGRRRGHVRGRHGRGAGSRGLQRLPTNHANKKIK